eukprot:SAG22_NODE_17441_length_304_cov_89.897561_1_plen_53_part_01
MIGFRVRLYHAGLGRAFYFCNFFLWIILYRTKTVYLDKEPVPSLLTLIVEPIL